MKVVDAAVAIKQILALRYSLPQWVYATEVPTTMTTGFWWSARNHPRRCLRRLDAFAISAWASTGYRRVAYEIKVSRSDWLNELRDPEKSWQGRNLSNQFYFALGPGVYRKGDVAKLPPGCGILEVLSGADVRRIRTARVRDAEPMPTEFVIGLMRRLAQMRQEAHEAHEAWA